MERNWTLALMLSLAAHGALAWAVAHGGLFKFSSPGLDRAVIAEETLQPPVPPPQIIVAKPALPKIELPEDPFGVTGSKGEAFNSVDGKTPMQARKAEEDQAFLRREKPGNEQPKHELPSPVVARKSTESHSTKAVAMVQPPAPAVAFGIADGDPAMMLPKGEKVTLPGNLLQAIAKKGVETKQQVANATVVKSNVEGVIAKPQASDAKSTAISAKPQAAAEAKSSTEVKSQAVAAAASSAAGAPVAAVQAESDSDAFSKKGSAEFRGGRLIAKGGRWVHTISPDITIAGYLDIASMSPETRYIVMRVDTNESGEVTDVDVIKSTGKVDTVDLPCRVAMYKWKFQPPKDKNGQPRPDTMIWTINFR